jgi:hypothetical protein
MRTNRHENIDERRTEETAAREQRLENRNEIAGSREAKTFRL